MKEINPKVYYLVCRNIAFGDTLDKDEQRNKDIFYGKKDAIRDYERNIVIVKEILLEKQYIQITSNDLKDIYYKISKIEILETNLISLVRLINNKIDNMYEKIYQVIKEIVVKNTFNNQNEIMAKLVMNLILKQEQYDLIIPYPNPFKLIMENIANSKYTDYIKKLLERLDVRTKLNSYKHDLAENKKTLLIVRNITKDIKSKFLIKEVYIYGSLARGDDNEYSDLDLLLITSKENMQKIDKDKILEYLYKYININIDLKLLVPEEMNDRLTIDMKRILTRIDT